MPNYHKYKCPECGQELDGLKTDNHSEYEEIDETVQEWRVLYWCLSGCGVKRLWITETTYFDDDEAYQIQEIVANYWTSSKDECAKAQSSIGDDS